MALYLDSSALVKRYVAELQSAEAQDVLLADQQWITAGHAYVEISLALARRLDAADVRSAMDDFERDWRRTLIVAIDDDVIRRAAAMGVVTGCRTLDALHLAAAERSGGRALPIVTFDLRLAQAARSVGFTVIGS